MYKLVIQDDEGKTTVVPLIRDELTIGRKEGNTIRLTERNVSRRHARVARSNGSVTIEDLDSYNGIRVNGSRIQGRVELQESDRVQIGDYLIEVRAEMAKSEAATVPMVASPVPVPDAIADTSQAATVPTHVPAAQPAAELPDDSAPPTERIPVLSEDEAREAVAPASGGKLVVLSTNLAGREFELDKPAMVIGRTDENDIWINHRSISRHHAKVVRENGRYAIVDLQSSNGVRVNGEEYGKVELRRGDLVDLGHVRLRYVDPGEDFVFGRDAHAVDISGEGKSRGGMWAMALLLLIGGGVAAFMLIGRGSSGGDEPAVAVQPVVEPVVEPASETPDPVVEPAVAATDGSTAAEPGADLRTLLDQAIAARQADDWAKMKTAAAQALALEPDSAEAQSLLDQAVMEAANQTRYDEFAAAVAANKYARIAELFAQLDENSVYRVKAQPEHDKARAEYVKYQSQVARRLASRGECGEQRQLARRVVAQWPEAREAVLSHSCRVVAVRQPTNPPDESTGGGADAGDSQQTKAPEPAGPSLEELVRQSEEAGFNNQHAKSLKLCRQALEKSPSDQRAIMACAIAACNLGQGRVAEKYMARTKSKNRQNMIYQICMGKGVKIDGN